MNSPATLLRFAFRLLLMAACLAPAHTWSSGPFRSLKEIRERGVVLQQWESSCAAAAVATVLTYTFADAVSEFEVIQKMLAGTSAERVRLEGGFSLLDMKRFVEARGYAGRAFRALGFDDVRNFRAPIVSLRGKGYDHFVVVSAVVGETVFLADPAFGNRRLSRSAFEAEWVDGLAFLITKRASNE